MAALSESFDLATNLEEKSGRRESAVINEQAGSQPPVASSAPDASHVASNMERGLSVAQPTTSISAPQALAPRPMTLQVETNDGPQALASPTRRPQPAPLIGWAVDFSRPRGLTSLFTTPSALTPSGTSPRAPSPSRNTPSALLAWTPRGAPLSPLPTPGGQSSLLPNTPWPADADLLPQPPWQQQQQHGPGDLSPSGPGQRVLRRLPPRRSTTLPNLQPASPSSDISLKPSGASFTTTSSGLSSAAPHTRFAGGQPGSPRAQPGSPRAGYDVPPSPAQRSMDTYNAAAGLLPQPQYSGSSGLDAAASLLPVAARGSAAKLPPLQGPTPGRNISSAAFDWHKSSAVLQDVSARLASLGQGSQDRASVSLAPLACKTLPQQSPPTTYADTHAWRAAQQRPLQANNEPPASSPGTTMASTGLPSAQIGGPPVDPAYSAGKRAPSGYVGLWRRASESSGAMRQPRPSLQ